MEFGRRTSRMTNVRPGMTVFAALGGGGFSRIDHSGVVVKVLNRIVMIAQHSVNVIEPIWRRRVIGADSANCRICGTSG